jgi:hypothetical protein
VYPDDREYDPDPPGRGWETAAAVVLIGGVVIALAALAGQGLAALLFGRGWVWPRGGSGQLARAVGGLLTGRPGTGLTHTDAGRLPGRAAVYAAVLVAEMAAAALLAAAAVTWSRYRRPRDARRGMATRTEAARTLGRGELRRARAIIRPDLGDQP